MKHEVFCPLCKKNYKVKKYNYKKTQFFFVISILFSFVFFLIIDKIYFEVFFSLFPLMIFIEYGKRLATRFSLTCPYCAFDIITYKKDKTSLVKRINVFNKTKKLNLEKLLNLGL